MRRATARNRSARFIFTYRQEKADGPMSPEEWRGWVARVPDAEQGGQGAAPTQKWFRSLEELPGILRSMLGGEDALKRKD